MKKYMIDKKQELKLKARIKYLSKIISKELKLYRKYEGKNDVVANACLADYRYYNSKLNEAEHIAYNILGLKRK